MKLPWKTNSGIRDIDKERGAALPLVLFFSIFALITISIYFLHQTAFTRLSVSSPVALQALLNARSGVYKAFCMIQDTAHRPDTLKTIDTRDSLFGDSMFNHGGITIPKKELTFDTIPHAIDIYNGDTFGTASVQYLPSGSDCIIVSTGEFRDRKRMVWAKLESHLPAMADTVVIVANRYPWNEPMHMTIKIDSAAVAPLGHGFPRLSHLLAWYNEQLLLLADSALIMEPLTIQSSDAISKIPAIVKGPLIIDGSFSDLAWNEDRAVTVLGDLQVSGTVHIKNVRFIVSGDVKLFDKSDLLNVSVYSTGGIWIKDFAHLSKCDLLALRTITMVGNAEVIDKSICVVAGTQSKAYSTDSLKQKINRSLPKVPPDTSMKFSLICEGATLFDGVGFALGQPGNIRTVRGAAIKGILWAVNAVCHEGKMEGLIRASKFVECSSILATSQPKGAAGTGQLPQQAPVNAMTGEITPLQNSNEYPMPFFMDPLQMTVLNEK